MSIFCVLIYFKKYCLSIDYLMFSQISSAVLGSFELLSKDNGACGWSLIKINFSTTRCQHDQSKSEEKKARLDLGG